MTQSDPGEDVDWRQLSPEHTPRLRLKPKALPTGYVDGAWWPRSDDLAAELPDLLAVLSVRLGQISNMSYLGREWANTPARVIVGGCAVRLEAYRRHPQNTVEILGVSGTSIMLLVVPPATEVGHAHSTMMSAAARGNSSTPASLLVGSPR